MPRENLLYYSRRKITKRERGYDMNEAFIKKAVTDALQLEGQMITNIRRTPGGVTNKSYFATINGKQWVVRLPGAGTKELVNRREEKDNLLYGTRLGMNPPLLFFNTDSGLKITQKIEGAIPVTPALTREGNTMKQIIQLCKHLHDSEIPMKNEFKLLELISHYESLVLYDVITEKLAKLKKDIVVLQTLYESFPMIQVPCHIDMACSNFIKNRHDEMYLIDWEYSGMFDPLWDIATLFLTLDLQEEEKLFFLKQYLERKPTEGEVQRILMHTIFQDYLWCLWALFKEAQGDDVGGDAMMRFERATGNIALYKSMYEEDIVV